MCGKSIISPSGVTVFKGARVSGGTVPSFETRGKSYFRLRQQLESDGTIVDMGWHDYKFNAPSTASAIVIGQASN